jgi:hypothetical protein
VPLGGGGDSRHGYGVGRGSSIEKGWNWKTRQGCRIGMLVSKGILKGEW